jgi:D-glycero-D-manno-heptose 1,7-bisphosphate phosphatase
MALLRQKGVKPFVFTQQNCIGKGLVSVDDVNAIHDHMNRLLGKDARIEKFYLAWNTPGEPESARAKPSPAMIHEVMAEYTLKPEEILVVGDSMRDFKSAQAAGVGYVWVRDDLHRVPEVEMQATGCKIYNNVHDFARDAFQAPPVQMHRQQVF